MRAFRPLGLFFLLWAVFFSVSGADGEPYVCRDRTPAAGPLHSSAGCMVRAGGKLLAVRLMGSGKLDFPGGTREPGESARCTAERETWEESGVDAFAGPLLKVFGTGYNLFLCRPAAGALNPGAALPLPSGAGSEVTEVTWIDPHRLKPDEWRFPEQVGEVVGLFDSRPPAIEMPRPER
jgi:8-oxo-dGTP pyrophosphatase MutT (NUDIX family)